MAKPDLSSIGRRIMHPGARAPLVIAVVLIAIVAAAYYGYYRQKVEYYNGRNLRLLAMLTSQIEGRVGMFEEFVRTPGPKRQSFQGMEVAKCPEESGKGVTAPAGDPERILRSIEDSGHGWRVALGKGAETVTPGAAPERTCATVALDNVLRPILARKVGAAFDMLLVTTDDGTVLYSIRPPPASSTLLSHEEEWIDEEEEPPPAAECAAGTGPHVPGTTAGAEAASAKNEAIADRESGSSLLITQLGALSQQKGWREYAPLDLKKLSLSLATNHTQVALDGTDYILFTQPYTFARAAVSPHGNRQQWIVCGLVSASRFGYEVKAISTTIILIAIFVALLAVCSWPFLRIALIDPGQALTITDVVLVVICTMVGAAVITLALLDVFAYRGISQTADEQLKEFSRQVNDDFGADVVRAMNVLDRAEETTADRARTVLARKEKTPVPEVLPPELLNDPKIGEYPYIDAIAWIDKDGMQQVRFARIPNSSFNVSARKYFQLASAERTSLVNGHLYVLEWVRSKATGEVRAILAQKTREGSPFPVIALTTELIDISHAVRPPGVEMAIIDENGEVIYHSDAQRIGYENFFAEADRNRELRSAVLARRAENVTARYWGEDHSMFVRPLTGSAWTLVTFWPKRLKRVLNVEAALLTLMLLLLSSTPYLLLYIVVLLVAPRYRAPRLWPDVSRGGDYLRLSILLVAILALFCLNNSAFTPWSSFYGIVILPLLAIVTTYLVLHRSGAPRRYHVAIAVWIAVNAALMCHVILSELNPDLSEYRAVVRWSLAIATLGVAAATVALLSRWRGGGGVAETLRALSARGGYSRLYRLCGALLLAIGVAMPVVGFFNISRHVESELLVKYAQLRAAVGLVHRIDHVETLNVLPRNSPSVRRDILFNRLQFLFGSDWWLEPPVINPRAPVKDDDTGDPAKNRTVPPWAASWLPALYEDSIAIRPLFEGKAADNLWHWSLEGRTIKLVRKTRFDRDVACLVWSAQEPPDAVEKIVITSRLPRAFVWQRPSDTDPAPPGGVPHGNADPPGGEPSSDSWLPLGALIAIGLPLLASFWYASDFIARQVLLIDVSEPDWLARKPLSPSLGDHIFLVRRDRPAGELTGSGKGPPFFDIFFEELHGKQSWSSVLETLDSSVAGRNVRIVDFEYGINDGAINEEKLRWLERLLALPDRTVIVVSSVSPAYIMTTPPPAAPPAEESSSYLERWRALLDRFVCVTEEELELRDDEWNRRNTFRTVSRLSASEPKTWLDKETQYNSFLRRLRTEIDPAAAADRKHLIDEISERAETYYAGLWSNCRDDEKLLLYHIAQNGLANGRNRRILRRLIARGLVRRGPNLELFSETFRLYVLGAARRQNLVSRAAADRAGSTWDSLRMPFFIIIVSFLLLLFATQKDLLTTTTALATALTTGLPVMMKLIGIFTEQRSGGAAGT